MARKIVTNLRIDEADWLQIKTTAAELGMSVNEYIIRLIRDLSIKRELATDESSAPIWHLSQLHKKIQSKPLGKLSEEDEIIYGIK